MRLLKEAGLPDKWCQLCLCAHEVSEVLATDTRVQFLSFIGSAKVGWSLRSKIAAGTRCVLEHGGVAPVIVDQSADLEVAIPALLKGGFYHAGQVCVSVQRIFVHEKIFDEFTSSYAAGVSSLVVGDPTQEATDVGPLISAKEVLRIDTWVQEALSQGATLLTGGKPRGATMYEPTILLSPPENTRVSTEEIFGPVVCLYRYSDLEQAIAQANSLPYAFQAAVFARDENVVNHVVQFIDASTVMINDSTTFREDQMPFAGRRLSGLGVGGIGYTMRDMVMHKMVVSS